MTICKHFQNSKHLFGSEVDHLMQSNLCRSSTTSVYMLSVTDFNPKGTISEVRVHAGAYLDKLDADRLPNADSPRSSWNRLITMAGIFLGTSQLAYRRGKSSGEARAPLGRSVREPRSPGRSAREGHATPENFWKIRCDSMHFRVFWGT